jgi:hypothetical protein
MTHDQTDTIDIWADDPVPLTRADAIARGLKKYTSRCRHHGTGDYSVATRACCACSRARQAKRMEDPHLREMAKLYARAYYQDMNDPVQLAKNPKLAAARVRRRERNKADRKKRYAALKADPVAWAEHMAQLRAYQKARRDSEPGYLDNINERRRTWRAVDSYRRKSAAELTAERSTRLATEQVARDAVYAAASAGITDPAELAADKLRRYNREYARRRRARARASATA